MSARDASRAAAARPRRRRGRVSPHRHRGAGRVAERRRERAIVALLGTNGAGKTTTLRAISGFLGIDDARVTEGAIALRGERIENLPPHAVTARGIVLVPERDKVFANLTVAENLIANVPRATRATTRGD